MADLGATAPRAPVNRSVLSEFGGMAIGSRQADRTGNKAE
jgi:hypothetical protein